MRFGGFAGKILNVNLSQRKVWTTPLDETLARQYVGGLGICIKLASEQIPQNVSPLSEETVCVIGIGPLVGTDLP